MSDSTGYKNGTPKVATTVDKQMQHEPCLRWIRVEFNGTIIADSKDVLMVWEKEY